MALTPQQDQAVIDLFNTFCKILNDNHSIFTRQKKIYRKIENLKGEEREAFIAMVMWCAVPDTQTHYFKWNHFPSGSFLSCLHSILDMVSEDLYQALTSGFMGLLIRSALTKRCPHVNRIKNWEQMESLLIWDRVGEIRMSDWHKEGMSPDELESFLSWLDKDTALTFIKTCFSNDSDLDAKRAYLEVVSNYLKANLSATVPLELTSVFAFNPIDHPQPEQYESKQAFRSNRLLEPNDEEKADVLPFMPMWSSPNKLQHNQTIQEGPAQSLEQRIAALEETVRLQAQTIQTQEKAIQELLSNAGLLPNKSPKRFYSDNLQF